MRRQTKKASGSYTEYDPLAFYSVIHIYFSRAACSASVNAAAALAGRAESTPTETDNTPHRSRIKRFLESIKIRFIKAPQRMD